MDEENALELLHLSHKYRLPSLTERCGAYLAQYLCVENVLTCLQSSMLLDLSLLQEHCLMYVEKRAKEVFCDEGFPRISQQALNAILQRDSLQMPEIDVYRAALKWTKTRCQERNLEPTGENLREVLGSTVTLLRFPCMHVDELSQELVQDGVLSKDHLLEVLLNHVNPGSNPTNFSTSKRKASIRLKRISHTFCSTGQLPAAVYQSIPLETDRNTFLYGLVCSCKTKGSGLNEAIQIHGKVVLSCLGSDKFTKQECSVFTSKAAEQSDCVYIRLSVPMLLKPGKHILDLNFQLHNKYTERQEKQHINISNNGLGIYRSLCESHLQALQLYSTSTGSNEDFFRFTC